jgi:hypothetical protein
MEIEIGLKAVKIANEIQWPKTFNVIERLNNLILKSKKTRYTNEGKMKEMSQVLLPEFLRTWQTSSYTSNYNIYKNEMNGLGSKYLGSSAKALNTIREIVLPTS